MVDSWQSPVGSTLAGLLEYVYRLMYPTAVWSNLFAVFLCCSPTLTLRPHYSLSARFTTVDFSRAGHNTYTAQASSPVDIHKAWLSPSRCKAVFHGRFATL
jgi:hypothetical protein